MLDTYSVRPKYWLQGNPNIFCRFFNRPTRDKTQYRSLKIIFQSLLPEKMTLPETEKSPEKDIKTSIADRRSMIELNSQNWKKNVEKDKVSIA